MNKFEEILSNLRVTGNLRKIPEDTSHRKDLIDFSLNDYLGLGERTDLREEFFSSESNRLLPMTSSASRLLASSQEAYFSLEEKLGSLYDRPVMLFNSGYHANTGLISSLSIGNTLILADKLVHASMIDGMTLGKVRFMRFRHNDPAHLKHLIEARSKEYDRILILVESVYSMDGDIGPLEEIAAIKRSTPKAMLYVDEAHAFGVLGTKGLGLCRDSALYGDVDFVVGTFGKACASMGAFCAFANNDLRDYAVNRSRSFIFSTALPPMTAAWTEFMIDHIIEMDSQRQHLLHLGAQLAGDKSVGTPHHIYPVIVGSAEKAVRLSQQLLREGLKVLPIRTPTVPPGTERLRISLSTSMTGNDISHLRTAIDRLLSS